MATFQLFYQSGRPKDLSAPLYVQRPILTYFINPDGAFRSKRYLLAIHKQIKVNLDHHSVVLQPKSGLGCLFFFEFLDHTQTHAPGRTPLDE